MVKPHWAPRLLMGGRLIAHWRLGQGNIVTADQHRGGASSRVGVLESGLEGQLAYYHDRKTTSCSWLFRTRVSELSGSPE